MLDTQHQADLISFAVGMPSADHLPVDGLIRATERRLRADPGALALGPPSRILKAQITRLLHTRGIECDSDHIFLTRGAQQALDLLVRLLVEPGTEVLADEVTYTGLQMALQPARAKLVGIRSDARSGMDLDALEARLAHGPPPAFLYSIADGHNPLGISIGLEQRKRLLRIARRHDLLIVEDDPYGLLDLDGERLAPLHALDPGQVIYIGTFSKIAGPALRCGWIVAPHGVLASLSVVRDLNDIDSADLTSRIVGDMLAEGDLDRSLVGLRQDLRERRNLMLGALERHLPRAQWETPRCGLFVWIRVPEVDTAALLERSIEHGVMYVPGVAFGEDRGNGRLRSSLRLSYGNCDRDSIEVGIMRLARVMGEIDTNGQGLAGNSRTRITRV